MKPKKYSKYTLTGQKGVNLIERIVLDMGFVWHARTIDAGIDGMIELRNDITQEAHNFHILVQSKATEVAFVNDKGPTFEYTCDERDIEYWLKGNAPVILICSNVVSNEAYWVNIKEYFKEPLKRKNKKVVFDKTKDGFKKENKQALINISSNSNPGIYFAPVPKNERIVSNLLPLVTIPDKIFVAKTKYRKKKELWSALNELENKKGINKNWMLSDGKIYSFNDLSQAPWSGFITEKTIESFKSDTWSQTHDLAIKNNFINLLNNTFESVIHHKGIIHVMFDKINLFYFKPRLDSEQKPKSWKVKYVRFGRNSHQSVCEKYARKSDPTVISFYRHLAFETKFYRYDMKWYLEITPTYFFTHDGFKMHYYYEQKLKGKKALDRAAAVFSETVFWDMLITKDEGMFGAPILKFNHLWQSNLDAGIDDELWLKKEDIDKSEEKDFSDQLKLVLK